jgi:hypothetical protein
MAMEQADHVELRGAETSEPTNLLEEFSIEELEERLEFESWCDWVCIGDGGG